MSNTRKHYNKAIAIAAHFAMILISRILKKHENLTFEPFKAITLEGDELTIHSIYRKGWQVRIGFTIGIFPMSFNAPINILAPKSIIKILFDLEEL